jgi:hypothetical protein
MCTSGRAPIVKAAFTVEPRFDGEAAEEMEGSEQPATGAAGSLKKAKDSKKRRRTVSSNEKESSNKRKPCWVCDGNHRPRGCFCALGIKPRRIKIPEENKKIFEKRMKDPSFADRIQKIRDLEKAKKDIR